MDLGGLSPEEKKKKLSEVSAQTGIPVFEPRPIHKAYSKSYNMSTTEASDTEDELVQHYAEFIYATKGRPRIACLPAGYFAPNDPVVVIDEKMILDELPNKDDFKGIIGIHSERGTILFKQYDDQGVHYIRDEKKQVIQVKLLEPGETAPTESRKKGYIEPGHEALKRERNRKRIARKTRRNNNRRNK
ncbi:MAG: hypothetical protein ACFCUI_10760 [Bernardetiaceae bacterium]